MRMVTPCTIKRRTWESEKGASARLFGSGYMCLCISVRVRSASTCVCACVHFSSYRNKTAGVLPCLLEAAMTVSVPFTITIQNTCTRQAVGCFLPEF